MTGWLGELPVHSEALTAPAGLPCHGTAHLALIDVSQSVDAG